MRANRPVAEIENFVVERIGEIANNATLLSNTLGVASRERGSDMAVLWAEEASDPFSAREKG